MEAMEFNSIISRENTTPLGGSVAIGIGPITNPQGEEIMGTAFQIKDQKGELVAQFALTQGTFAVFFDTLMEVYREADFKFKNDYTIKYDFDNPAN